MNKKCTNKLQFIRIHLLTFPWNFPASVSLSFLSFPSVTPWICSKEIPPKGRSKAFISMLIFRLFNFRLFKGWFLLFGNSHIELRQNHGWKAWKAYSKEREEKAEKSLWERCLLIIKWLHPDKITIYHSFNLNSLHSQHCVVIFCVYLRLRFPCLTAILFHLLLFSVFDLI